MSESIYPVNVFIPLVNDVIDSLNGAICPPNGAPYSLRYQANGSAYAQQKLGNRWLAEARTVAVNSEALIDPHDLELVNEVLLLYVLHL